VSFLPSSFVVRYGLHYKLPAPTLAHGQNTILFSRDGLERPRVTFGHGTVAKSGVVPAQSGVLPAPKLFVAHSATPMLFNTFVHPAGERNGERRGDLCVSCICHPAQQFQAAKVGVH